MYEYIGYITLILAFCLCIANILTESEDDAVIINFDVPIIDNGVQEIALEPTNNDEHE